MRVVLDSLSEEKENGNQATEKKILAALILLHGLVFVTYVPVLQKEPEVATEVTVIHFSLCWISIVANMYYMKYTLVSYK